MRTTFVLQPGIKQQRGFVLVVAIIMLLVITILGLSGTRIGRLSNLGMSNAQDRANTQQAAEDILRDGERDCLGVLADGTPALPPSIYARMEGQRPIELAGLSFPGYGQHIVGDTLEEVRTYFTTPGRARLWVATATGADPWAPTTRMISAATALPTHTAINYGVHTGADPLLGVSDAAYMLFLFRKPDSSGFPRYFCQVFARAVGGTPGNPTTTVVVLTSTIGL